jgi:hypothetical protein
VRRNKATGLALTVALGAACTTDVVSFSLPETSGLSRYVHYTCCDPADLLVCTEETMGGETSCKDAGLWKGVAGESCQGQGLTLTAYSLHGGCASADDAGTAIAK